jgi:hypothetical protein
LYYLTFHSRDLVGSASTQEKQVVTQIPFKMYTSPPEANGYAQQPGGGPGINQKGYAQQGASGGMGGSNQNMLGSDQADMMLNLGISQGQNMLKQQQERWMPGISGFWQSLKIYFAVNNVYVVKKLSMILYPVGVKSSQSWIRKNAEDGGYDVSAALSLSLSGPFRRFTLLF